MSDWLDDLPARIGQIFVARKDGGGVALCHRDDVGRNDLLGYEAAEDAREIALYDDGGVYRPLKTAPTLRHGWRLSLRSAEEAVIALDYFYPGRAAVYRTWRADRLAPTSLRVTLNRQTGMYRVAAKIGETQADEVIAKLCRSEGGCLRTILWRDASPFLPQAKFDPGFDQLGRGEETLPLLCQEACNLLVAEMRKAMKDLPDE